MKMPLGVPRSAEAPAAPAAAPTAAAERVPPASADPFRLAYGVLGIVGFILVFLLIRFTVDDAFVSWRYGQSLLDGAWNWNPVDKYRVEAYSDPLYTALSVVPAALGLMPEFFFKLVGLGLLAGYLIVVHRQLDVPRLQRLLLTAFAVANPVFFVHAFSGLETASFALLLAALFGLLYARGRLDGLGHVLVMAVALSRPEGMVYALVAELWCLHLNRRRADALAAASVGLLLTGYWIVRAAYFHSFFPNPYLLKSGAGATDVVALAHSVGGLVGMCFVIGGLAVTAEAVRRLRTRRGGGSSRPVSPWRDATPALLAGVSALIIMVLYRVSSLQMDFGNRFCWQLLFPVALVLLSRPLYADAGAGRGAPLIRQKSTAPDAEQTESAEVVGVPGVAPASVRWTALTLLIAAITTYTGIPDASGERAVTSFCAVLACVAAVAVWIRGSRVPVLLAATALVTALSAVSTAQILDWSTYRLHLSNAQGTIGSALAADHSISGVIAVEDAGILPMRLRPDQFALDLDGVADPFLNKPVPASVTRHLVAMAVGSDGPIGDAYWGGDSTAGPVFAAARAAHFRMVDAVMYAPGYWLRLYVKPGIGAVAARRLAATWQSADLPDNEPSSTLLSQHLFDFPFLHG
ncbi:MAG TPA: hypothetical protein VFN97_23445 [Actinospica sp.]|nr:hypothetical protein [Actinospica sp.]